MKFLLFLLVIGGLAYGLFAQRQTITHLQAALAESDTKIRALQQDLVAAKKGGAYPEFQAQPSRALVPPPGQRNPSDLLDRNHRGPLDR